MDLIGFLKKTREDVLSLNNFEEVHIVIGNSACDLDSTVSAILHAFYLSKVSDEGNRTIIPVLNIPREDYALRTEVVSYLSSHRLEETLLTFRDDLDLQLLVSEKKLKLTLVDHNVLNQEDSEVFDSLVVEIIDHRENARKDDEEREMNIVIEPVGSCVTLVVGNILEESEDLVDERIAMLATGTILLDTVNLSSEAGRTTPKDVEVLDKLRKFCPNVIHQDIFDSLQRAKFDISGLSAMDVLRKDYKSVCGNDSTIGLSSIPCSIEQLLQKLEGEDTFSAFCESRGLSALLLVSMYHTEDGSLQRELGIFSLDTELRNKLETHFSSDSAGLLLEYQSLDCIGLSCFHQGNVKASRKVILPLAQNFVAEQSLEKTDLKDIGKEDVDQDADGVFEGNKESGATEIKVVETTDLLGAFEMPNSQTTNPFGSSPLFHGNTNNSNPFQVESTLPAQEYNLANNVSSAQSSQQVFNLFDLDPMSSASPSSQVPQSGLSGLDDLFGFDPFASTTSSSVMLTESSHTNDAGFSALDDTSSAKGPTDSFILLDLGETATSEAMQPLNNDLQVPRPVGGTKHSLQMLQDDLVAFQPLEGTTQVHDGIARSSFDEGGDVHANDGQIRSSSPQIAEEVNDELIPAPQGNNPFVNIGVKSSLVDAQPEHKTELSADSVETYDTMGSMLFDSTGDPPQGVVPEEKEVQSTEGNHPTQPSQDYLVAFQPLEDIALVHDENSPGIFDEGSDINSEDGKTRLPSHIGEEINDESLSVESLSLPQHEHKIEISSDSLGMKNETTESLLFDFMAHPSHNAVQEGKENELAEEIPASQQLKDDLVALQPIESSSQVHDGIAASTFGGGGDMHSGVQMRSSSLQIDGEVNDELLLAPQGNNRFANGEAESSLEDVTQDQTMEFYTDDVKPRNDTPGSVLSDFTGDLSQNAVQEEKEELFTEENQPTQSLEDNLVVLQTSESQVHDGIGVDSFDEKGDMHGEDNQMKILSPQMGEEVNAELLSAVHGNNPFLNATANTFPEIYQQDDAVEFSTETLETEDSAADSVLLDITGDLPEVAVPAEKEEQVPKKTSIAITVVQNMGDNDENDLSKSSSSENLADDGNVEDRYYQQKPNLSVQELDQAVDSFDKLDDGSSPAASLTLGDGQTFADTSLRGVDESLETIGDGNLNILEEREAANPVLSGSEDLHTASGETFVDEGSNSFVNNNSWDLLEDGVRTKNENDSLPDLQAQVKENVELTFNVDGGVAHETESYRTSSVEIRNVRNYSAPLTPNNSFGDVEDVIVISTPQIDEDELSEKVEELHRSRSQSMVEMEMDTTSNLENENELTIEVSEKLQTYQELENVEDHQRDEESESLNGIIFDFDQKDDDFERNGDENKHQEERQEENGDESATGDVVVAGNVNLSLNSASPEREVAEMDGNDGEEVAETRGDVLDEVGGGISFLTSDQNEEGVKDTDSVSENGMNKDGIRESLSKDVGRVANDLVEPQQLMDSEEERQSGEGYNEENVQQDLNTHGSESDENQEAIDQEDVEEESDEGDERNDEENVRSGEERRKDGMSLILEAEESQLDEKMKKWDEDGIIEVASSMDRQDSQYDGEHGLEVPHQEEYLQSEDKEEIVSEDRDGDTDRVYVEEKTFGPYVTRKETEDENKEHRDKNVIEDEVQKDDGQVAGDGVLLDAFGNEDYCYDQSDATLKESQFESEGEFISEKMSVKTTDLDLSVFDSKVLQEPVLSKNVLVGSDKGDIKEDGDSEKENSGLQQFKQMYEDSSLSDTEEGVGEALIDSSEVQDVKAELLLSGFHSAEQGDIIKDIEKVGFTENEESEEECAETKPEVENFPSMEQGEDRKSLGDDVKVNESNGDVGFTSQDEVSKKIDEQPFDWRQLELEKTRKQEDEFSLERDGEAEDKAVVDLSVGFQQENVQTNPEFERISMDVSSDGKEETVEEGEVDLPVVEDVKQELLLTEPVGQVVTTEVGEVDTDEISDEKIDEDMVISEDSSIEEEKREVPLGEFQSSDQTKTTGSREEGWTQITDVGGGMGRPERHWGGVEVKTNFETRLDSDVVVEKDVLSSEPALDVSLTFDDKLNSQVDEHPFDRRELESREQEDLVGFNSEKTKEIEDNAGFDTSLPIQVAAGQVDNEEFDKTVADSSCEGKEEGVGNEEVDIQVPQDVTQDVLVSEIKPADKLVSTEVEKEELEDVGDEGKSEDEDSTGFEEEGGDTTEAAYEILSDAHEEDEKEESSFKLDRRTDDGQEYPNVELDLDLAVSSAMRENLTVDHVVTEDITSEIEVVASLNASSPATEVDEGEQKRGFASSDQVSESNEDVRVASKDEMQRQLVQQPFDREKFRSFDKEEEREDGDEFGLKRDEGTEDGLIVDLVGGFMEDEQEGAVKGQESAKEGLVDVSVVGGTKQEPLPIEVQSTDQLVTTEAKEVQWIDENVDRQMGGSDGIWGEFENLPKTQKEVKMGFEDNFLFNEHSVDVKVVSQEKTNSHTYKEIFDSTLLQSDEEMKDHVDPVDRFDSRTATEQENETVVNVSGEHQEEKSFHSSLVLVGSLEIEKQSKEEEKTDSRSQKYEVQTSESDVGSEDLDKKSMKEKKKERKKSGEKSSLVSLEGNHDTPMDKSQEVSTESVVYPSSSTTDRSTFIAEQSPHVVPSIEVSIVRDINLPEFSNASWEDPEDTLSTAAEAIVDSAEVTQQFETKDHGDREGHHEETYEESIELGNALHIETSDDIEITNLDLFEKEKEENKTELPEDLEQNEKLEVEEVSGSNNLMTADDHHTHEELNTDVDEASSVTVPRLFEEFSTDDLPITEEIHVEAQVVTEVNTSPPTIEGDDHARNFSATYPLNVIENPEESNREHVSLQGKVDQEVFMEESDDEQKYSSRDQETVQKSEDRIYDELHRDEDDDNQFVVEDVVLEELGYIKEDQSVHEEQGLVKTDKDGSNLEDVLEGIVHGDLQGETYSSGPDEIGREENEEILSDNLESSREVEKKENGEGDVSREEIDKEVKIQSSVLEFVENSADKYEDVTRVDQDADETAPSVIDSQFVGEDNNSEETGNMMEVESVDQELVSAKSDQTGDKQGDIYEGILSDDSQTETHSLSPNEIGQDEEEKAREEMLLDDDDDTWPVDEDKDGEEEIPKLQPDNTNEISAAITFENSEVITNKEKELEESSGAVGVIEDEGILSRKGNTEASFLMDPEKTQNSQFGLDQASHILDEQSEEGHTEGETEESGVGDDRRNDDDGEEYPNMEFDVRMETSSAVDDHTVIDQLATEEIAPEIHLVTDLNASPPTIETDHNELDFRNTELLDISEDTDVDKASSVTVPQILEEFSTNDLPIIEEIHVEARVIDDVNANPPTIEEDDHARDFSLNAMENLEESSQEHLSLQGKVDPTIEIDHNELDFRDTQLLDISEDTEQEASKHAGMAEGALGMDGNLIEESAAMAKEEGHLFASSSSSSSDFEKGEMNENGGDQSSTLLVSVDVHQEAEAADSSYVNQGGTDGEHEPLQLKFNANGENSSGISATTGEEAVNVDQPVIEEITADTQLIADLNANPTTIEVDHNELDFSNSYKLNIVEDLESKVDHTTASVGAIGIDDRLGVSSEGTIPPADRSNLEITAIPESEKTLTSEHGHDSMSHVVDEMQESQTSDFKTEDKLIDDPLGDPNLKDGILHGEVVISDGDNKGEGEIENQATPEEESTLNEGQASVSKEDGEDVKIDSGGEGRISGSEDNREIREKQEGSQVSPESTKVESVTNLKRTVIISSNFTDLEAKQFELSLKPPGNIGDEEVFSPTQSDFSESGVDMSPGHPVQTTRRERPNSLSLSDISVSSDKGAGVVLPHVDTPSVLSPGMESISSMYSHEGYFISPDFDGNDVETPTPVSDLKPMEEGPLDPVLKRPLSVDSELTQNVSKGWADNQSLLEAILVQQEEKSKETDQAGNLESEDDVTPVDTTPDSITKETESNNKDATGGDVKERERGEAEGAEEDDADDISITISRKDPPLTPPEVASQVAEADSSRGRLDTMLSDGSLGEITLDDDDDEEDENFDPESKGAYSGAADSPGRKRLSVGLGLDSTSVTTEVLDAEYPAVLTPSSNEMSWDDDTSVDKKNTRVEPIPEYTAKEEHEDRWRWRKVKVGDTEYTLDNKVIEPYKKVLSHGGYYGESVNAIIVVASCYLPEKSRKDYHYVMQNLFLYVVSSLELLVAQDYMIVYFHGAAPRDKVPSFGWMKRCYQMIDRRLRKNLKGLYIVHPTAWLKTVITFTRPFISAKFYRKLKFIYHLDELKNHLSMEYIYVPEEVKRFDKQKRNKGVTPTSGWLENEQKPISSISSGYPSPPYNSHSRHRRRNPYPEADQSFMPPDDNLSFVGTEGPDSGQSSPRMSFSGSLGFFEDDFLAYAESHQPCSIEEYLMQQRELFEKLHQETEEEYRLEDAF